MSSAPSKSLRNGRLKKGLTLVEVLAAVAVAAIGVTSSLAALGAIGKSQARERKIEEIARLANEKYQTVFATYDLTQSSQTGDFTDEGINGYTWATSIQQTTDTNLSWMTLTVKDTTTDNRTYSVTGLVFVPPTTTTGGAGTTTTTTGGGRAG